MPAAAGAARPPSDLAGVRFKVINEFARIARTKSGVGGDNEWRVAVDVHRGKILYAITGLSVQNCIVDAGPWIRRQERIAIRCGLSDCFCTEYSAGARAVVDDELLPEALGEFAAYQSRRNVIRSARRKGHDQAHGFQRVAVDDANAALRNRVGRRHHHHSREGCGKSRSHRKHLT